MHPKRSRTPNNPTPSRACALCGWSLWVWVGSALSIFVFALAYNTMLSFSPGFFGVAGTTYGLPSFWLQLLLVPTVCILIETLFYFISDEYFPSPVQLGIEDAWLQQQQQQGRKHTAAAPATEEERLELGAQKEKDAAGLPFIAPSVAPAN